MRQELRDTDMKLNDYRKAQEYKQQYGEYPVGTDPNSGVPNHWRFGDSVWGLESRKRELEQKLTQEPSIKRQVRELEDPTAEERRLREEGARDIRLAETDIRRAEQNVGAAKANLRAAEDKLSSLPAGDPAKIQAAEQEVTAALSALEKATAEPYKKLEEAKNSREAAIRDAVAAVEAARERLAQAPQGYKRALEELDKLAN